jgi:oxygen-independent coproporphyrinogen-3 oxidase
MAGIYIHIPFCSKACHYCDFHFSTLLKNKIAVVNSIAQELIIQKEYLGLSKVSTIYFGGGTPSLLSTLELEKILKTIRQNFVLEKEVEITLEANPDDLTLEKVQELKATGINRLSIGIQSFHQNHLEFFNRSHTEKQAFLAIENAKSVGINNLSIDLIYGFKDLTEEQLQFNLKQISSYQIPHVSAYALTVEPKTALSSFIKKGMVDPPSEELAKTQFLTKIDYLQKEGLTHYEISNFGKPNFFSKHNTSYWKSEPYLGVGPSAHSFNGKNRQWNIANNVQYLKLIHDEKPMFQKEELTEKDKLNELIMIGLRTIWGIDKKKLSKFSSGLQKQFLNELKKYLSQQKITETETSYVLQKKYWFLADGIASSLFQV